MNRERLMHMIKNSIMVLLISMYTTSSNADIYKCKNNSGNTVYSGKPCAKNAEKIKLKLPKQTSKRSTRYTTHSERFKFKFVMTTGRGSTSEEAYSKALSNTMSIARNNCIKKGGLKSSKASNKTINKKGNYYIAQVAIDYECRKKK